MVDYLESLERLAMPDELHIKECEKLGIGVTEDFDIVEQALLELKAIKEANPSEALECLKALQSIRDKYSMPLTEYVNSFDYIKTIKHVLLKQQEQKKFFDDMLIFKNGCMMSCFEYSGKQIVAMPLEEYDEFMKQEKALEIIKEKNVNVKLLKLSTNLLDYYTRVKIKTGENTELTEEEYDLLKEVLG